MLWRAALRSTAWREKSIFWPQTTWMLGVESRIAVYRHNGQSCGRCCEDTMQNHSMRLPPITKTKAPLPTDRHVGHRIRMRRVMLEMSQEKLGQALGLTFQQVQKYEKGINRVGASRLKQIADILQVPIAFFFEDAPGPSDHLSNAPGADYVSEFLATSEGLTLARSFVRIARPALRRSLVRLVEELSDSSG